MNRREFLKKLPMAAAALPVAVGTFGTVPAVPKVEWRGSMSASFVNGKRYGISPADLSRLQDQIFIAAQRMADPPMLAIGYPNTKRYVALK